MGVDDPYVAYCLDEAVGDLGARVSEALAEAMMPPKEKPKALQEARKRQKALERILAPPNQPKKYREPPREGVR